MKWAALFQSTLLQHFNDQLCVLRDSNILPLNWGIRSSPLFLSEVSSQQSRYARGETGRWETEIKAKTNGGRQEEVWLRKISDVWKHIPQAGLSFLIQGVRRQQRGEENSGMCDWFLKESIWDILQAQKCNPWAVEINGWCFVGLFGLNFASATAIF